MLLKYRKIHDFDLSREEMVHIQERLAQEVEIIPYQGVPQIVSGVDLSFQRDKAIAVIVTFDYKSLSLIDLTWAIEFVKTSYMPGFLAFRELPIFLKAWENLQVEPDVVFFDGQGYAHPRRMGLATHASFFIEKPTIGIAKSKLVGDFVEPGYKKGDYSFLYHKNEKIGIVLRTKDKVKPVFISPGNWLDFDDSLRFTLHFCTRYRIPEITRQAHIYTQKLKERGFW